MRPTVVSKFSLAYVFGVVRCSVCFFCYQMMLIRPSQFFHSGIIDSLAGALLSTSCKLSPHLAKAHLELGNWAFKRVTVAGNEIRLSFISEECDTVKWQIKVFPYISKSQQKNVLILLL